MDFDVVRIASETHLGGDENDDCAAWIRTPAGIYAWVIDGATSVAEENHVGARSGDVAWYSNALSQAISANADRGLSAKALHARAVADVADLYAAAIRDRIEPVPLHAQPLAAITIVRITGSGDACRGDLFHLADCPAFTLDRSGHVVRVTAGDGAAEAGVVARVVASQASHGFAPKAIMAAQMPWLRERREIQLRRNPLEVSTPVAGMAFAGWEIDLDLADVDAVVLMSDGFERYTTHYALGDDSAMVTEIAKHGPDAVLHRIREVERSDPTCRTFPRLKASDDATCVVLRRSPAEFQRRAEACRNDTTPTRD
jgi:hypothetical protein